VAAPDDPTNWQRGLGDGFTLAVEFVVTPLLLALVGWFVGATFGASVLMAAVLGGIGFVGCIVRTYYAYLARCAYEDEGKPWTRSQR
jgi:F0F1-type ATP synthase assembly protein I